MTAMKQDKDGKPPARVPSSGRGASSALDAMLRKRIPAPPVHAAPPKDGQGASPQAAARKRRP